MPLSKDNTCISNSSSPVLTCPKTVVKEYTNVTGCPVIKKCEIGMNGMISLDADPKVLPFAAINTTIDGQIIIPAPVGSPCSLIIQNNRQKSVTLQVSGPNVAAQLVKLDMSSQSIVENSKAYTAFSLFTLKPTNDMMIMYVGSIDPKENSNLVLAWKNDQQSINSSNNSVYDNIKLKYISVILIAYSAIIFMM
eukprot:403368942